MIDGKTRLLGVLGSPVSHSLSPKIHNFAISQFGLNQVYVPFDIPVKQIKAFMDLFWDMGGQGLNITTPYKEIVANLIQDPKFGSVNTLYRGERGWMGISTDGFGFERALTRLDTPLGGFSKIVFLGNGGAVSAILEHISREFETCPEVVILRRSSRKDREMLDHLPDGFPIRLSDFNPPHLAFEIGGRGGETLLVQATSAPLFGDSLSGFADAMANFHGVFVDLIYGTPSAMLKKANLLGIPCQDGLPMLMEQARLSQERWWGKSLSYHDLNQYLTTRTPR